MKVAEHLKFNILGALKAQIHHPYKMPINPLWKDQKCPCKNLKKSEWPEKKVYPWSPPRFFDV